MILLRSLCHGNGGSSMRLYLHVPAQYSSAGVLLCYTVAAIKDWWSPGQRDSH